MKSKKGQYFSFDAIVSVVIFVMAITILLSHWYSLKTKMNEQTTYLQDEALRISEILLGPGDFNVVDPTITTRNFTWYEKPLYAKRAGFGKNGSFAGDLATNSLTDLTYVNLAYMYDYLDLSKNYNDSRLLLATATHYYAVFNLSAINGASMSKVDWEIGYKPPSESVEKVIITRPVYSKRTLGIIDDYVGTMTLYIWTNSTRS